MIFDDGHMLVDFGAAVVPPMAILASLADAEIRHDGADVTAAAAHAMPSPAAAAPMELSTPPRASPPPAPRPRSAKREVGSARLISMLSYARDSSGGDFYTRKDSRLLTLRLRHRWQQSSRYTGARAFDGRRLLLAAEREDAIAHFSAAGRCTMRRREAVLGAGRRRLSDIHVFRRVADACR